jgi:chaperone required for assembly of F1-ATPase
MKRFYKLVSTAAKDGGYVIELDGKPVRTPGGRLLLAPAQSLATLIAAEWTAQVDNILPDTMPLTQLLVTALDRVEQGRADIQATALGYLDTDLVCYRAADPEELVKRETAARDPWLRWFEKHYNCKLNTTTGLVALRHDDLAHVQAADAVRALDLWAFNVLQSVTASTGSLVLALAFVVGPAQEDDLLRALYVEEDHKSEIYNEEFYGRAPHQEKAMAAVARDLKAGREFLEALGLKKS